MTELQQKFENDLLECQKELIENPNLLIYCKTTKEVIKRYIAEAFGGAISQDNTYEIFIETIVVIKRDIINQNGWRVCGISERRWIQHLEKYVPRFFRIGRNEFNELLISCTKDEELTHRQQALIWVLWKKIGWPVHSRSSRLKEFLSE